jgi:glycosyltransferase involved in cell wall biosynthesis
VINRECDLLIIVGSVVGDSPSGGDSFLFNVSRVWAGKGEAVAILTTTEGARLAREIAGDTPEVLSIPSYAMLHSISLAYFARALKLSKLALSIARRSKGPITIVAASPFLPDALPAIVARAVGASWVLSWQLAIPPPWRSYRDVHSSKRRIRLPRYGPTMSFLSERLTLRLFSRLGSVMLVPNRQMALAATRMGVSESRIVTHRLGSDASRVTSSLSPLLSRSQPVFDAVFLGRFHEQKGLEDLSEVWRSVLRSVPSARLAIIGGGRSDSKVRRLFNSMPEPTISFLGPLTGDGKYRALLNASLFVFPSRYESFGHVVLEAMACGLPVIAYDIPSSKEAFGRAVYYVPFGDTASFAAAVVRLLKNEELRKVFANQGIRLARTFDWESIALGILDAIRDT